ncbi:MAG: hypothetical protein WAV20_24790 [Blastocatellia bacterium]
MMRKLLVASLICVVIASAAVGDTIHLKNGSVLKGKVTSFADDQFIVMLDTGSGRYLSKAMVYMGDVARIEFDSVAGSASESSSTVSPLADQQARVADSQTARDSQPRETKVRDIPSSDSPARNPQPAEPQPREVGPPPDTPLKEPEPAAEKPNVINTPPINTSAASETADADRLTRRPLVAVKTMSVDVIAKKDWTSSGLIVKRGDHLRVTATGTITLDPSTGRTCGPEGVVDLPDPKKLMPDQPTGALIGVISSDNDDFIFIGRAGEFTATRDGLLFLSVNEGALPDNIGLFRAVVEVLSQRK